MRRHLGTLQNCYDTRRFRGAQSVSCVSYVPFCTNLCTIPSYTRQKQSGSEKDPCECDHRRFSWFWFCDVLRIASDGRARRPAYSGCGCKNKKPTAALVANGGLDAGRKKGLGSSGASAHRHE